MINENTNTSAAAQSSMTLLRTRMSVHTSCTYIDVADATLISDPRGRGPRIRPLSRPCILQRMLLISRRRAHVVEIAVTGLDSDVPPTRRGNSYLASVRCEFSSNPGGLSKLKASFPTRLLLCRRLRTRRAPNTYLLRHEIADAISTTVSAFRLTHSTNTPYIRSQETLRWLA